MYWVRTDMESLRVAIVHDWLVTYAGAERVLEQHPTLARLQPGRRIRSSETASGDQALDRGAGRGRLLPAGERQFGRLRFGNADIFPRSDSVKPLLKAVKQGRGFFNLPDMDFGMQDAAFVPFFGIRAATLTASPVTSVSPSQRPIEWPSHEGSSSSAGRLLCTSCTPAPSGLR